MEAECEGGTRPYDTRTCSLIIMNENKRAPIIFKAQQSKLGYSAWTSFYFVILIVIFNIWNCMSVTYWFQFLSSLFHGATPKGKSHTSHYEIKVDKNSFLKTQISISKNRQDLSFYYIHLNSLVMTKQEGLHQHVTDVTQLFTTFQKQPQQHRNHRSITIRRNNSNQLGHKPKSSLAVWGFAVVVVNVQMDNLSQSFSSLREHQNHLEVLLKHGLLGLPPKFLFQ